MCKSMLFFSTFQKISQSKESSVKTLSKLNFSAFCVLLSDTLIHSLTPGDELSLYLNVKDLQILFPFDNAGVLFVQL